MLNTTLCHILNSFHMQPTNTYTYITCSYTIQYSGNCESSQTTICPWEPEGHYHYSKMFHWEAEGRYHYSKMFHWEPEGHYHHRLCTAIAPFWFSTGHISILIAPFWLSTDKFMLCNHRCLLRSFKCFTLRNDTAMQHDTDNCSIHWATTSK